jgi:hypothetical protein
MMNKQNRHDLHSNPYIKYLGRSITVLTYTGRKLVFKPMSIATNRAGEEILLGPNTEGETVRIPARDILSVWQDKTKTR